MKIVLVGNPNVGKSIIFSYLSGKYVEVSNFPGTTVEIFSGKYKDHEIFDTPGIYSVASFNDEEKVAKKYILEADVIINVVDSNHLERDLFLTLQLIDLKKKLVVALNIYDELEKNKISLDHKLLSEILGIPVVPTVAPQNKGLDELEKAITEAKEGIYYLPLEKKFSSLENSNANISDKVLILEDDLPTKEKFNIKKVFNRDEIYFQRRLRVNELCEKIIRDVKGKRNLGYSIGRIAIHPFFGIPFSLVILYFVYLFIGVFVAGDLVDFTKEDLGTRFYEFNIKKEIAKSSDVNILIIIEKDGTKTQTEYNFPNGMNSNTELASVVLNNANDKNTEINFNFKSPILILLFGEFGILTMTVSYVLFLLLPLVLAFYFSLSILEDSGYLPRLATIVDKMLSYIGLNGRAIIPIILGFGCVSMATITTRILGSKRERTIATTILQLAIPCSAQLGVIATLLARTEFKITIIYICVLFLFLAILGTVLSKFVSGETTSLLIDLPLMRLPRAKNVFLKTFYRSYGFMKEATPWFFFGAILISLMQITDILNSIIDFIHPIVVHWLNLPKEAGIAFVMGLVRRDFGAAGLYDLHLTSYQTLVALLTLTLFVPCITSVIIMFKERGAKEGGIIWAGSILLAFLVGGIVAKIFI